MIEFKPDGPFAEKPDLLFPDRVRILGLGHTGVAACDQLILQGCSVSDIWVFDSDQQTVDGSIVPNRHLLGRHLVHGLGANGDVELAREIVALEENRLSHVAHGCDFLILIVGLAGATGMALSEYLIEEGRKSGARVIVIGVQPFAFEGWARREKAVKAIGQLRREADSVLVLSQDRLTEDQATAKNVRNGFHFMHRLMAQTAQALAQIVCKRGLVQLSFADVRSLYGRYAGSEVLENCWVTHTEGDIHDRAEDLIETLLKSPLLEDEAIWKRVDHAIVAVSGTRALGLSDVQELVGLLKDRLPAHLPIATSASLEDEGHEKVRITVLLAMTAPIRLPDAPAKEEPTKLAVPESAPAPEPATLVEPIVPVIKKAPTPRKLPRPVAAKTEVVPVPTPEANEPASESLPKVAPAPVAPQPEAPVAALPPEPELEIPLPVLETTSPRVAAKQEEMQFEGPTRGRFEKTHETIYNGENLDLPTFRRRRLVIQL